MRTATFNMLRRAVQRGCYFWSTQLAYHMSKPLYTRAPECSTALLHDEAAEVPWHL